MSFEPIGGYPPIIKKVNTVENDVDLEKRGFQTTNFLSISKILENNRKTTFSDAFGPEDGVSSKYFDIFNKAPEEYKKIKKRDYK
jgi:hypothetical protein